MINASGTFDAIAARRVYGDELLRRFPFSAFVSKTITPEPRDGNPPPRLWETPAGMINSIGLPNKGLAGFLEHDLPRLAELPVPLVVSVMATSAEDFSGSSPASPSARRSPRSSSTSPVPTSTRADRRRAAAETAELLEALRPLTDKPLIVKLTPNVADPAAIAVAAEASGADSVSLINTLKATALDPATLRPWLGGGRGGLSGPAVRAVALEQVGAVSEAVTVPVIGMGGVCGGSDALEMLAAGASLVAVGTESFRDPGAGARVLAELVELLEPGAPTPAQHLKLKLRSR